jgi:hypothetical protein
VGRGEDVIEMFNILIKKIIESYNSNPEFRALFPRSTVITAAGPISDADAEHRKGGHKFNGKCSKKDV